MKQLFRHTNTTQSLAGFVRWAVLLLGLLCYVDGTWAQTLVRKGTINSDQDVAIYNQMMAECPVDISEQLGVLTTWTGDNINHTDRSGQHWNGNADATYSENQDGWNNNSWSASMTKTITLPKGKYLFIGPGRCSENVVAYFKVGNLSARVYNGGDTGLGINTEGQPSFSSGTFANNGNGRGWRYTYIQFELACEMSVTFKIEANATGQHQFMSFTNPSLYKLSDELTTAMFKAWSGAGGNARITNNTGCAFNIDSSSDIFYGDIVVHANNFADLTDYSTLELTVTEGTPRLLFNRQTDNGNDFLEINSDNSPYVTVEGNRWIIDLDKVANDRNLGYVHLNCIKANWGNNVTITSATLTGPSLRSLFHQWDGTGANADVNELNPANFVWRVGEEVASGSVIYGENRGWVPELQYADLTPYSKMVVTYDDTKNYPRFMFNKAGGDTFVVEVDGQNSEYVSVSGNKITIDLSKLCNDNDGFVHLNCIKSSNGGSTIVNAVDLVSFVPSTNITQKVGKTFTLPYLSDLRTDPREFTVKFHFVPGEPTQWTIDLINNSNNEVVVSLPVDYENTERYWFDAGKFGDNVLHVPFYVRWYLKDKSGNIKNIDNSLINPIYRQTITSEDGVVWSARMDDVHKGLDDILFMTVDGTPDGGTPFDLVDYDLVCAISEAGNDKYFNGTVSGDASPINIEYTFHFAIENLGVTNKEVTHKISYLRQYTEEYEELELDKQGLASDKDSDWKLSDGTQKVNEFKITHYLKVGQTVEYLLPTAQNTNDHTMYQRWYNYKNEYDLQSITDRVTLFGYRDNNNRPFVPYYLYKNGLVTGDRIYWGENRSYLNAVQTPNTPYCYTNFRFTNTDGTSVKLAADVSRYSDMTYENPNSPLDGNLKEPSLTMRYIYNMKDAREMASQLTYYQFKGDTNEANWLTTATETTNTATDAKYWMESKVIHFPSRELAYENSKLVGYRGNFLPLFHRFSDYWIFDDPDLANQFDSENPNSYNHLNDHLIAVDDDNDPNTDLKVGRNIVVKIYDPNNTKIRLGGYNPNINLKNKTTWPTPQVGDIIRVTVTNTNNSTNYNAIFKRNQDWSDFTSLQNQINKTPNYFEARIDETSLGILQAEGLRIQGNSGFHITRVEIISQFVGNSRTIWEGNVTFNAGDVDFTINQSQFALTPDTYEINEGNDADYKGYYYHDLMNPWSDINQYDYSRFLVFRYPESGKVDITDKPVYLRAYFVDPIHPERRYQLAQYTIIFDSGSFGDGNATLPWVPVNGGQNIKDTDPTKVDQYIQMDYVKDTPRAPRVLREKAGEPIAKITFDYPAGDTYHFPEGATNHGQNSHDGENYGYNRNEPYVWPDSSHPNFQGTIPASSPIPLTFDRSNYAFDGENALFGAYALVNDMNTRWGNQMECYPANHGTRNNDGELLPGSYGYAYPADKGYQSAFLYIDASELPGDICSAPFVGEFCPGERLMVTGWISGANNVGDIRSPGGITLTLKGEHTVHGEKVTETLYRFCPGMVYELNDGAGMDGHIGGKNVVWQQFYFEFVVQENFERHWIEVNNNCVSSQGGDFMLDNIEVYTIVPEIKAKINTPICTNQDGTVDMRLLKLTADFNKMKSTAEISDNELESPVHYLGMVFLEKDVFLNKLKEEVNDLANVPLEDLADSVLRGKIVVWSDGMTHQEGHVYITKDQYKAAFDAALLRSAPDNTHIWESTQPNNPNTKGAGLLYFKWSSNYETDDIQPVYSFADAANKKSPVFRETDVDGNKHLVFNGNYPELPWKAGTEYYLITTHSQEFEGDESWDVEGHDFYGTFNLCSKDDECTHASILRIEPPLEVLGLDAAENMEDLVACEGQIPTLLTNLKGYDINGKEIKMKNLNFDWWLGKKGDPTASPAIPPVLATLDNYHTQYRKINEDEDDVEENRVYLNVALSTMRAYYPDVTSLDVVTKHIDENDDPKLTQAMIDYLQELVDAGELVLHQSAISVPAEKVLDSDPYFYLVACPIHDEAFTQALNPSANEYVSFYCDEPQGVRIKLGQKAPKLQTGFVPNEHGFTEYNYDFPANTNPVLSIRLAKAAQFETVKNTKSEVAEVNETVNYLWLPIRNAETETAKGVIHKSNDDNIYLAASNDLTWDKKIAKEMNKYGSLPVVGRIVQLKAVNTKQGGATTGDTENAYNRLAVYFNKDFNVREGYNYTLRLPFQEDEPDDEKRNVCDGTILINLKIVPDYEVWTGAAENPLDPTASNTDWNNDENWRRADGNTASNLQYDVYGDELYRANGAANNPNSPLHTYTTNKENYYSSATSKWKPTVDPKPSSDQVLRKGFAPLYCTHVLMSRDEWGNAPELYDALDYKKDPNNADYKPTNVNLVAYPFPNLRETSTPILKFDMQARRWDMWEETYGEPSDRGSADRPHDLIAEMYQINSCDEIVFQPGTELLNAHLLNYNNAWVEYQLDNKRWYLLGSPLQGTISGEWYAPKKTAQQKTTYYDPVAFRPRYVKVANPKPTDNPVQRGWFELSGETYSETTDTEVDSSKDYYYHYQPSSYDRYNPAIYQRSWDKAKAVLYEVGSEYDPTDDSQTANLGNDDEGIWSSGSWNVEGGGTADEYLDRLGYKPMGGNKANVAIKGIWSNTYNDAQVDYATGGFSVMVMNHLKNNEPDGGDTSGGKSIVRLPKEDTMYDYYEFSQTNATDGGTDTKLSDVRTKNRALNRGRLKTDLLLPEPTGETSYYETPRKTETKASVYGDQRTYTRVPTTDAPLQEMNSADFAFTETVPAGVSNLGFYLVENPFTCGLDMAKFFEANADKLEAKYWLLTKAAEGQNPRQVLVQQAGDEWVSTTDEPVVYTNPNYKEGESDESEKNLTFYPHAVLAPGQGFFVQAKSGTSGDLTVTFNRDMQAQSRFGVIKGNGKTYEIVVGQAQVMEKMYDSDDDGIPDTRVDDDYEGETIMVDTDNDGQPDTEKNVLSVLVYEKDENTGEYITDDEGNKIPKLTDIVEDVVIYNYVPETLTIPDDPSTTEVDESGTVDKEYPLLARTRGEVATSLPGLVITAQRGSDKTSAMVMLRSKASNDFLPEEDTEVFINSDFMSAPTVYTLCGRLATTINSIHDFRSLPLGVESNSDAPCTLTFKGVEMLGDSISFYDALEQKLTPLKSGMKFVVSGQTQNRYYLVRSLIQEEAAAETHIQIFTEGLTAKVIASTGEPITNVRCYDTAGRLIHSASPQTPEYSFSLPIAGIYIISAETENDRKTKKVMTK